MNVKVQSSSLCCCVCTDSVVVTQHLCSAALNCLYMLYTLIIMLCTTSPWSRWTDTYVFHPDPEPPAVSCVVSRVVVYPVNTDVHEAEELTFVP